MVLRAWLLGDVASLHFASTYDDDSGKHREHQVGKSDEEAETEGQEGLEYILSRSFGKVSEVRYDTRGRGTQNAAAHEPRCTQLVTSFRAASC